MFIDLISLQRSKSPWKILSLPRPITRSNTPTYLALSVNPWSGGLAMQTRIRSPSTHFVLLCSRVLSLLLNPMAGMSQVQGVRCAALRAEHGHPYTDWFTEGALPQYNVARKQETRLQAHARLCERHECTDGNGSCSRPCGRTSQVAVCEHDLHTQRTIVQAKRMLTGKTTTTMVLQHQHLRSPPPH